MKYPEYIMKAVRQSLGLEENDRTYDDAIEEMPRRVIFRRWLEWQGIIGYGETILAVVEDIYDTYLEEAK